MAKNFIALEETSQAIKTTVEETKTEVESVGTAVNEIKEDVSDGAGTDLVTRVANLEAKIDALQTAIERVPTNSEIEDIVKANVGGSFKPIESLGNPTDVTSYATYSLSTTTEKLYFVPHYVAKYSTAITALHRFAVHAKNGATTVTINGKKFSLAKSDYLDLPAEQVIEISVSNAYGEISYRGQLYKVE